MSEMYADEQMEADSRAGHRMWAAGHLNIELVENTLELADLEGIVKGIQPEFADVNIKRRVAGPAAGGTGVPPEAALILAFTIAAHGFLDELGRDAYRGFRAAVFSAYARVKEWANARRYAPLILRRDDLPNVSFVFRPGMSRHAYEDAFVAFCTFHDDEVAQLSSEAWVSLFFDDLKVWQVEGVLHFVSGC
jgi:hypothetical protein